MKKHRTTDEQWLAHYRQALTLKLSLTQYAASNNILASSFHSAVKRLRKKGLIDALPSETRSTSFPFVKVALESIPSIPAREFSAAITLPSGIRIELGDTDTSLLIHTVVQLQGALANDVAPH